MLQITATPKELAELVVAIRDGEFGSDPAERYFSREDARAEVAGARLEKAQDDRDEAFALAAIYPLTLDDLCGKTAEELEREMDEYWRKDEKIAAKVGAGDAGAGRRPDCRGGSSRVQAAGLPAASPTRTPRPAYSRPTCTRCQAEAER